MGSWRIVDASGTERDLETYYGFKVQSWSGADAPPVQVFGTPFASIPGEAADGERIGARDVFLVGTITADTWAELQQNKAALFDALKPWRSGQLYGQSDAIKLRYVGSQRTVELECKYVAGFDGRYNSTDWTSQRLALQFRAQEDVWWHATSQTHVQILPAQSIGSVNSVLGRVSGSWTSLGPPSSGGTVRKMVHDGTNLYVGGSFTNWDGDSGADYFVKWDGSSWSHVATGGELNDQVYDLVLLPDGTIVLGGYFTDVGGDTNADYCVIYDPVADSYSALGTGPGYSVTKVAYNTANGHIYVIADMGRRVIEWDGSSWTDISPSAFRSINAIWTAPDGTVWVGGDKDDGYPTVPYRPLVQSYDGSTWTTEIAGSTTSANEYINAGGALSDGRIVVGGAFSELNGVSVNNVAIYNGQAIDDMDTGVRFDNATEFLYDLFIDDEDMVWIAGTSGGVPAGSNDLTIAGVAFYNGSTWLRPDYYSIPITVYSIAFNGNDYYLGGSGSGTMEVSNDLSVTVNGGGIIRPQFVIVNGGSSGAITLRYIGNETLGLAMHFDLNILEGETVTIDCQERTITSSFGRRITGQPLPGSDFADFYMSGSSNTIVLLVNPNTGYNYINSGIYYYATYDGISGGDVT